MLGRAPFVLVAAALFGSELAVAQIRYRTDKPPANVMPQPGLTCSGLTVDSQIALRRATGPLDDDTERVDFVITASIANPCEEPLQVRPGSALTYETNFPFAAAGGGQPPSCQSREFAFAGVVPPRSQQPFTLSVRNCAFEAGRGDRPTVSVASGRVVTNRGERAVPATSQTLP